ncbi:hypothetical protein OG352_27440 [Streptomyces sp. NBC_01485]|uniref:hypothetical protein n=1 Tax=Streptomyces sp. NBC_01485 TaxID=2903884 RepID=UPI002E35E36D|nr:hypothetical protein [Streptomyces sp. NBC_01485]
MTSLPNAFWHEIRGKYDRLPVWLPGTPMELGDIGTFSDHRWTKFTTLKTLKVPAKPDSTGDMGTLDYASHDGVTRSGGLTRSGVDAVVASARGDASYTFTRKGAFVLRSADVTVHRLANLEAVRRGVLELHEKGEWRPGWVVITEVAIGGPGLLLVSAGRSASANVRMRAQAALDPTVQATLAPSFEVEHQEGLAASLDSPGRSALMWRGYKVKDPLLREATFAEQRGEEADDGQGTSPEDLSAGPTWAEIEYPEDLENRENRENRENLEKCT